MGREGRRVGARPGEESRGMKRPGRGRDEMALGRGEIRGAEEPSPEYPVPPDSPASTLPVKGILSHSHISINEFITNGAKMGKER